MGKKIIVWLLNLPQITKKEYLWFDGDLSFADEPLTYITISFLFGFIPIWLKFREEYIE